MGRVAVYIDGFNMYHAMDDVLRYHKYKWLDYHALAQSYVIGSDELVKVMLFTAYARWDPPKMNRHKRLIKALAHQGAEVVMGRFKRRDWRCKTCGAMNFKPEEKRTDVNIAVQLLRGAFRDEYDKAIIITGDSDIVPAIEVMRTEFPQKKLGVVAPIGRKARELEKAAHFKAPMTEDTLRKNQLPDRVELEDGTVLTCPERWK